MVTVSGGYCDRCRRRNPVGFAVEPEEAWRTVVLNRWNTVCPSGFDEEAMRARVQSRFVDVDAMSWSERPVPRGRSRRRR